MNDLLKTDLFGLLTESSKEVTNQEMKNAYESFLKQVEILTQSESYSTIFRTLNLTRVEFASLGMHSLNEQGGKCLEKSVFMESPRCH